MLSPVDRTTGPMCSPFVPIPSSLFHFIPCPCLFYRRKPPLASCAVCLLQSSPHWSSVSGHFSLFSPPTNPNACSRCNLRPLRWCRRPTTSRIRPWTSGKEAASLLIEPQFRLTCYAFSPDWLIGSWPCARLPYTFPAARASMIAAPASWTSCAVRLDRCRCFSPDQVKLLTGGRGSRRCCWLLRIFTSFVMIL